MLYLHRGREYHFNKMLNTMSKNAQYNKQKYSEVKSCSGGQLWLAKGKVDNATDKDP